MEVRGVERSAARGGKEGPVYWVMVKSGGSKGLAFRKLQYSFSLLSFQNYG